MSNIKGVRVIRRDDEFQEIAKAAPESVVKRLAAMVRDAAASGEYGYQYGFMKIRGELNEAQFAACKWFDELHNRYLAAIEARTLMSPSAEPLGRAEPSDPIVSERGKALSKREAATVAEFESARLAGLACGGERWDDFMWTVIDDMPPTGLAKRSVVKVADALVIHRRLGSRHRRGRRGC